MNKKVATVKAVNKKKRKWVGACPFSDHEEKTNSFTADVWKKTYTCFGCKRKGEIIEIKYSPYWKNYQDDNEAIITILTEQEG